MRGPESISTEVASTSYSSGDSQRRSSAGKATAMQNSMGQPKENSKKSAFTLSAQLLIPSLSSGHDKAFRYPLLARGKLSV